MLAAGILGAWLLAGLAKLTPALISEHISRRLC